MDATTPPPGYGVSRAWALEFTGRWQEFLPIALTNLLLTVVTLGIYRFWAKARERQYLWSRTRFYDDHFDWTGTGKEMFLGFLIVVLGLIPVIGLFFLAAYLFTGNSIAQLLGLVLLFSLYTGLFYITGVASLRALRYRLSRTYWHGIRGGSDDGGWGYGVQYVWRWIAAVFSLWIALPWAQTRLWNARFNKMSFGQYRFHADADARGLMKRWLLIYVLMAVPFIAFFAVALVASGGDLSKPPRPEALPSPGLFMLMTLALVLVFYVGLPLAALAYRAAYYRRVAEATSIGPARFLFTARTVDWLLLYLGHAGIVLITLGFGAMFIGYRNYKFAVQHLHLGGDVDFAALAQSTTRAPTDAEGLADAFDIGAI